MSVQSAPLPVSHTVAEIGSPPWTRLEISNSYAEFKSVYRHRPVKDNSGGMKAPHAFAFWFMLCRLRPELVVESGVFRGQSTWLTEQACPDAEIVCLDIDFSHLAHRGRRASYIAKDFAQVDFGKVSAPRSLCLFDDHQNAFQRLQQMRAKGFDQAIFDDNYPERIGDCYSLKKAFGGYDCAPQAGSKFSIWRAIQEWMNPGNETRTKPNTADRDHLFSVLEIYYEFPPLFAHAMTRWGDAWDKTRFPTKGPIFGDDVEDELRSEAQDYTWMCYAKLKP